MGESEEPTVWIDAGVDGIRMRMATVDDVGLVLQFIRELAAYERLAHAVVATEDDLRESLFGERAHAEVVLVFEGDDPVGFALFFHNFSTFLGRPGLYLEDLFVRKESRGKGIGRRVLAFLASLAKERGCGRLEWWVLDWNDTALRFYRSIGALAMDDWTVHRIAGAALDELADEFASRS